MSGLADGELNRLAAEAIAALNERGLTISTAEATTGGLIGHLLTEIPGSSKVFRGGVAPYANSFKRRIGVPEDILKEYGAVSREAAEALAIAIRGRGETNVGLAETGIAGPTGAGPERPAGLFWIAVVDVDGVVSERFLFESDRAGNRRECAAAGLRMLLRRLQVR
ncbi:MAG: CinA family protein [Chloroflexota bacterium]